MIGLIHWLSKRRARTAVFAAAYFVVLTLSHDLLQQPAYWAQGQLSHRSWNALVAGVGISLLIAFCVWLARALGHHAQQRVATSYLAATVTLAILSFHTLLVMNIEVVHFLQYAILTILLYPITRRHTDTIILAILAALIDEGYQYFHLYADRGIHFDFNDVILNTIGAGFGLVFVLVFRGDVPRDDHRASATINQLARSPVCVTAAALLTAGALATWAGWIRILRDTAAPSWAVILRRGGPSTQFWTPTTWGKTYHEVGPVEWLLVSIMLASLYAALDLYPHRSASAET